MGILQSMDDLSQLHNRFCDWIIFLWWMLQHCIKFNRKRSSGKTSNSNLRIISNGAIYFAFKTKIPRKINSCNFDAHSHHFELLSEKEPILHHNFHNFVHYYCSHKSQYNVIFCRLPLWSSHLSVNSNRLRREVVLEGSK